MAVAVLEMVVLEGGNGGGPHKLHRSTKQASAAA